MTPPRFIPRYDTGLTPLHALQVDQRCSYRLYVPHRYRTDETQRYPLLVAVHGSWRESWAEHWADFCEEMGVICLAPLFPASLEQAGELDNYKFLRFRANRFDLMLLSMIGEVAEKWRIDPDRFLLFGFSGGAQFAHRFAYLHPGRLVAVACAAPGSVTLLDEGHDFWVGIRNIAGVFGNTIDWSALARVPFHVLVGADDTDASEITVQPHHADWMDGANAAGATRLDRAAALVASLRRAGIVASLEHVPGIGHDGPPLVPAVQQFFRRVIDDLEKNQP